MSIEQAITGLADAINNHADAIRETSKAMTDGSALMSKAEVREVAIKEVTKSAEEPKPSAAKQAIQEALAKAAAEKEAKAQAVAAEAEEVDPLAAEPAAQPTYDDVLKALTPLGKRDKAALVALLAHFGAKAGKDLKPEQYAEAIKMAQG